MGFNSPHVQDFLVVLVKELMVVLIEISLRKLTRVRLFLSFVKYIRQPIIHSSDDNVDTDSIILLFSLAWSVRNVIRLENDAYDKEKMEWVGGILRDTTELPPAYEEDVDRPNHHEQAD